MKKVKERLIIFSIVIVCLTIVGLAAKERYDADTVSYARAHETQRINSTEAEGVAILVAYRINKSSRMWLQNPTTSRIYEVGLTGRSIPRVALGTRIPVKYRRGNIISDLSQYSVKTDSEYCFKFLPGYNNVYP